MWIKPWKLTEGFIIGSGLVLTGLLLQLTVGPIDWSTFAWPVNLIVLVAFLAIALTAHLLRKRVYACQWLGSHDAAITSISWAVVLTLIMGLTRQSAGVNPHGDRSLLEVVGITQCLTWWPFALIYTWLTLSLALAVFRRASVLTLRNIPFMVMHTGLLVVLLCGTLGSADMQRLKMMTRQGVPEWRATDDKGNLIELDVAIDLKSPTNMPLTSSLSPTTMSTSLASSMDVSRSTVSLPTMMTDAPPSSQISSGMGLLMTLMFISVSSFLRRPSGSRTC